MNVIAIPFNNFLEISACKEDGSFLYLEFTDKVKNHLGTLHASAQFALAEACSGLCLQKNFPHLENFVVPVLRKSEVKFKRPATSTIQAKAEITVVEKEKFEQQFEKKGRGSVQVVVDVVTQDGTVTMSGSYEWFVQKL